MKNLCFVAFLSIILFSSCNQSSEDITSSKNPSSLSEAINQKLAKLNTGQTEKTTAVVKENDQSNFKQKSKTSTQRKASSKKSNLNANTEVAEYFIDEEFEDVEDINFECTHEETSFEEEKDGEIYKETIQYFDLNDKKITNCQAKELTDYKIISSFSGSDEIGTYRFKEVSILKHIVKESNKDNVFSYEFQHNEHTDTEGIINYDGTDMKILKGSYFKYEYSFSNSYNYNTDKETETESYKMENLFKFEFDIDGKTYRFDMLLNEKDYGLEEDGDIEDFAISKEFDLFDSNNDKIGIVKFTVDEATGEEKFEAILDKK